MYLELLPHNYGLPKRTYPIYTLGQMAKAIDEVQVHFDDSLVEEVPKEYSYIT